MHLYLSRRTFHIARYPRSWFDVCNSSYAHHAHQSKIAKQTTNNYFYEWADGLLIWRRCSSLQAQSPILLLQPRNT